MNIQICKLTAMLADDFFDFFDNRAFNDRQGAFCYCTWFHFDHSIEEHYKHGRDAMRNQAAAYIADGKLNGYLAFANGVSVGWCNADDKENYKRIMADPFFRCGEPSPVKAIVCFVISPDFRGKGVATALLQGIVEDARTDGFAAVEGYPKLRIERDQFDYAGPIHMYEKAGFVKRADRDGVVVMRMELF